MLQNQVREIAPLVNSTSGQILELMGAQRARGRAWCSGLAEAIAVPRGPGGTSSALSSPEY